MVVAETVAQKYSVRLWHILSQSLTWLKYTSSTSVVLPLPARGGGGAGAGPPGGGGGGRGGGGGGVRFCTSSRQSSQVLHEQQPALGPAF